MTESFDTSRADEGGSEQDRPESAVPTCTIPVVPLYAPSDRPLIPQG